MAGHPWDSDPELKQAVETYTTGRLRGQGAALKAAEARAEELEQQLQQLDTAGQDGAQAALELERLKGAADAFLEQVKGQIPEASRSLIPEKLGAADQIEWLSMNLGTLTSGAGDNTPSRRIKDSPGRKLPPEKNPNSALARERLHRSWLKPRGK